MKKRSKNNYKQFSLLATILVFTFSLNVNALQGNSHVHRNNSAPVNNNNNGNAGGGNQGNGYGNNPYGNQGNTTNNGRANGNRNNDSVPLDGGLSALLLGATAFGVKKLREKK
ncbi:PID-CTERM protein-sorting domain-containing protein [Litoribaculum gwangyangense]|uniref:VPEID-CTERM sorting domain-containing protein n=1 Tax=Litoribaculum gwangyangense TaxID=1130722 RepID=A0ABP9BWJ4_9FLAO